MSAPIGSNFGKLPYNFTFTDLYGKNNLESVLAGKPIKILAAEQPRLEKPVKAYKIRNVQTDQYWSGGRWRKLNRSGKVWTRMCDVKNVLNNMSQENFCKAEVVDYVLMPSTQPVVMLDDFNKVLDDFKTALQKAGKPV